MTITLTAVLLVVGCSVAFSLADLLRKLLAEKIRAMPLLVVLSAGMTPFFAVWRLAAGGAGPDAAYWAPGLGSVLLNIAANLAFLEAVRASPLSLTVPVLSLTPVFTTLLAVPLLGEVPSPLQLAGIAMVVGGVLWLNLDTAGGISPARLVRAFLHERGSLLMVVTALCWSLAMPLDKLAMHRVGPPFHGLVLNAGVALGTLAVLAGRGRLGELRRLGAHGRLLTVLVLVGTVALVLILLAINLTWIGFVETMKRGIGSFFALIWGRLFFAEPLTPNKLLAVLVLGAGVAMILL